MRLMTQRMAFKYISLYMRLPLKIPNSLQWLEIVFSIEEEFDIQFDLDELKELKTPRKLFEAARNHLAAKR